MLASARKLSVKQRRLCGTQRNQKLPWPLAAVAPVEAADTWAERGLRRQLSRRSESHLPYSPYRDKPSEDAEPQGSELRCRYQFLRDAFAVPRGLLSELRRGGKPRCMTRARKAAC